MSKSGTVAFLLAIALSVISVITLNTNVSSAKAITGVTSGSRSSTGAYTDVINFKYKYGVLKLTVKYKVVNDTNQIIDISHACTDGYMSFDYCKSDKTYATVAYKDNSGSAIHGPSVVGTIYADELNNCTGVDDTSGIKTYSTKSKSKYGVLNCTVKYKMLNGTAKIIDVLYDCTDKYLSFIECRFDEGFAMVVYKDTGSDLHRALTIKSVYADELS